MGELSIDEKVQVYKDNFSIGFIDGDYTDRVALFAFINHLYYLLLKKEPTITRLKILKSITKRSIPDKYLIALAIISENIGYGLKEFPTFDIKNNQIPAKIKEILEKWTPF